MKSKFLILLLPLFGIACHQSVTEEVETRNYTKRGDTITLVDNSVLAEKIKTTTVQNDSYFKEITTAAVVKAIPTLFARIAPPFSGRVSRSYMQLGQKIKKGAPLFEISSPDFIEAQKEFFQSKSDYQLAVQTLNRQKDLLENGVGIKKELEEAQNAVDFAFQEYQNLSEAIKTYNVNPESMKLGQHLIVRSPIAGEIIENSLVVGQFLKEDTESVAIVADLSKIWVVGQVKEKDIRYIQKNDEVAIQVGAYPDLQLQGKIFHIQEMINESTRSVEVLIESKNPSSQLKHGMYVTAKFKNKAIDKIMLSDKSVLQEEESAYVYIQDSKNVYIKRKIKVDGTQDGKIVVESGLKPNDIIVSEGGYYLLNIH